MYLLIYGWLIDNCHEGASQTKVDIVCQLQIPPFNKSRPKICGVFGKSSKACSWILSDWSASLKDGDQSVAWGKKKSTPQKRIDPPEKKSTPRKKIDPPREKKSTPQKKKNRPPRKKIDLPERVQIFSDLLPPGSRAIPLMMEECLERTCKTKIQNFFLQVCKEQAGLLRELCHGHDPAAFGSRYYFKTTQDYQLCDTYM